MFFCAAVAASPRLHAQRSRGASATAVRQGDLQVGGGFSYAIPDYSPAHFRGYNGYATLDFTPHIGFEFNLHQVNTPTKELFYERTYEFGLRYVRHYGRLHPYVRGSYGRGVFNYAQPDNPRDPNSNSHVVANLAYNLFAIGGGVDVNVLRHVNARADFDWQKWTNFPPHGLAPEVFSAGVAYHF